MTRLCFKKLPLATAWRMNYRGQEEMGADPSGAE